MSEEPGGTDSGRVWDKGAERERKAAYRARKTAYDDGYALKPNKLPSGEIIYTGELEVEWAKGVWQQHADRQTAGAIDKQDSRPRPEREKKQRR